MDEIMIKIEDKKAIQKDQLDDLFENLDCPFDAWDSKIAGFVLLNEYADWVTDLADWTTFLTLTFRNSISYDAAFNKFRYLVQVLNRELFGKRYTRIVGHSYFSYVICGEYQERDVLHFHVLIDRPVDYLMIHSLWEKWAGFAQTKTIKNRYSAVRYSVKYAIKESDIKIFITKALYKPLQYPTWWKSSPVDIF